MLNNIVRKLKHDKKATIAYFGGSVTNGFGSSNAAEYSWRALSGKHFKECFPDAEINLVNAAIGGTGSGFGLFRMEKDLLCHNPDLVFIEFSFNDFGYPIEEVNLYYESVIRKIRNANPETDIITVIISCDGRIKNGSDDWDKAHRALAEHYGLPIIDFIPALTNALKETGREMSYYLRDIVHPVDNGYALYAGVVNEFIDEIIVPADYSEILSYNLPEPKFDNLILGKTKTVEYGEITPLSAVGFSVKEDLPGSEYYMSLDKGDYFEFEFEGSHLSMWMPLGGRDHKIEGGAEEINCYIDGELAKTTSLKSFSGAMVHRCFVHGAENKKHIAKIENKSGGRCLISKIFIA